VDRARVTGNCRFDQTLARCRAVADDDPDVAALPGAEFTLIAGSTWPEDHRHILPAVETLLQQHPGMSAVIAPHEPSAGRLAEVEGFFRERGREVVRYTRLRDEGAAPARVVLVDCMGVLYKLYKKGHAAYVGGSFHQGVHSVMEPAGMGLPVVVGPVHQNSAEALLMIKTGGAVAINDRAGLEGALTRLITDPDHVRRAGAAALSVVENNAGATARTMVMLEEFLGPEPG
jgi:3-deoxy-D-manno-octulosonic-acid transferase